MCESGSLLSQLEGIITGSGSGRALLCVRLDAAFAAPHTAHSFVPRHSPDCIPAQGVTGVFAPAAALTRGELKASGLLRRPGASSVNFIEFTFYELGARWTMSCNCVKPFSSSPPSISFPFIMRHIAFSMKP